MPKSLLSRGFHLFLLSFMGVLFWVSLVSAPEGTCRNADALPLAAGWSALTGLSLFYSLRQTVVKKTRSQIAANLLLSLYNLFVLLSWIALLFFHKGNRLFAIYQTGTILSTTFIFFLPGILEESQAGKKRLTTLLLLLLLTAGVAESFFALYCYTVKDPALREAYRANPDKTLEENGFFFPKGSPERLLFENRLLESTEPLGTYGLTNTLAGVLVPVLTFLAALFLWNLFQGFQVSSARKKKLLGALFAVILMIPLATVLILTKSRAGLLAFFAGLILLLASLAILLVQKREMSGGAKSFLRIAMISLPILFALLILGAWKWGIFDQKFFTEAKKSLGYRLDYWQGSARMIQDYPWTGIGPGNFQSVYPRYMNFSASETIADPHNFVFEAGAVLGLPAAVILLLFLLMPLIPLFRPDDNKKEFPPDQKEEAQTCWIFPTILLVVGSMIAFTLSLKTEAMLDLDFFPAVVAAILLVFTFVPRLGIAELPKTLFLPAFAAGWVNLLAAGGLFYPATALPLFFLASVIIAPSNHSAEKNAAESPRRKKIPLLLLGLLFLTISGLFLSPLKVRRKESEFQEKTKTLSIVSNEFFQEIKGLLEEEGTIYAFCDSPILERIRLESALARYLKTAQQKDLEELQKGGDAIIQRFPSSAPICYESGKEIALARKERPEKQKELFETALPLLYQGVERYPSSPKYLAFCGLVLAILHRENAEEYLLRGLELDRNTEHQDQKLSVPLRSEAERFLSKIQKENTK